MRIKSSDQYEDFDTTNQVLGNDGYKSRIKVFEEKLDPDPKTIDPFLHKRKT